jgi:hypothetical protein
MIGFTVRSHLIPGKQVLSRVFVQRDPFLRCLGLAPAHHLIDDRALDIGIQFLEIEVLPLQPRQLSSAQTTGHVEKHEHAFPQVQLRNNPLDLIDLENVWNPFTLRTLADTGTLGRPGYWVEFKEAPTNCVVVENAQQIPNLCLRARRKELLVLWL